MNRGPRLAKPLVPIISEQWWSVTEYIYSTLIDFIEVLCYALILLNGISAFKYVTCTPHHFISYEAEWFSEWCTTHPDH